MLSKAKWLARDTFGLVSETVSLEGDCVKILEYLCCGIIDKEMFMDRWFQDCPCIPFARVARVGFCYAPCSFVKHSAFTFKMNYSRFKPSLMHGMFLHKINLKHRLD